MSNIQKEAARDAYEFARAQMFYGEGAGNRRKLIGATVETKIARRPGYAAAFQRALAVQDMAAHAEGARKERKRKNMTKAFNKNARAVAAGQYTGVNATVILLGTAVYVAHRTGYDEVVIRKVKAQYHSLREKHLARSAVQKVDATIHRIADYM